MLKKSRLFFLEDKHRQTNEVLPFTNDFLRVDTETMIDY